MSWLSEAFGIPAELKKLTAAAHEEESDFESAIAAGTAAAATIGEIAANPTNIAADLSAVPNLIADMKAGAAAASSMISILKTAAATKSVTKAASVSVVTHTPVTVTHPASGATGTLPAGSTISVPTVPEVTVPGSTFPVPSGIVDQGTTVTSVNADGFESPVSPDLVGEVGGNP